jgi:hypothetical protein
MAEAKNTEYRASRDLLGLCFLFQVFKFLIVFCFKDTMPLTNMTFYPENRVRIKKSGLIQKPV